MPGDEDAWCLHGLCRRGRHQPSDWDRFAYKESIPVIVLAADVSCRHGRKGALSWHEIPQRDIFALITKMSVNLESEDDAVEILRQALCEAQPEERGRSTSAFHVTFKGKNAAPEPGWLGTVAPTVEPDRAVLDRAAEELQKAPFHNYSWRRRLLVEGGRGTARAGGAISRYPLAPHHRTKA